MKLPFSRIDTVLVIEPEDLDCDEWITKTSYKKRKRVPFVVLMLFLKEPPQ
jgi:hypothetical protein